jgi:hypothetical protein
MVAHHSLRRLATHPADEFLYLGVLPHLVEAGKVSSQLFVGKLGVQPAVASAVQLCGLGPALGLGPPVVAVHAVALEHQAAAQGARAYILRVPACPHSYPGFQDADGLGHFKGMAFQIL